MGLVSTCVVIVLFLVGFLLWMAVTMYLGGFLWIIVMRRVLPQETLRAVALSGPEVPVLSRIWKHIVDRSTHTPP